MHELKEIRELTGLSQNKIAAWLNVSRSLVQMVEDGKRGLPKEAHQKLVAMVMKLKEVRQTAKKGRVSFTDPLALAELHRKKMDKHRQLAASLQKQLEKLQHANPRLQSRLALFDVMKDHEAPGYKTTEGDKKFIEMMEWFTNDKLPASAIEQQELLQDKIDTHLAYADLHQQRWGMYLEMG